MEEESLNKKEEKNKNTNNFNNREELNEINKINETNNNSNEAKGKENLIDINSVSNTNTNSNNKSNSLKKHEMKQDIDLLYVKLSKKNNKEKKEINIMNNTMQIRRKKICSQPKENLSYYERFINFQKRKEDKINQMKKELEENEKRTLKVKPSISQKSIQLTYNTYTNENLFERMKENEQKAKERKVKLIEKINKEREKKKEEEDRPLEFNIKPCKMDKKFQKIYQEMIKKDKELKVKISVFHDVVEEYKMRECSFHPQINPNYNINKENIDNNIKKGKQRLNSSEFITQRLYDDDLTERKKYRENLEKKYKYNFKPKISEKSKNLAIKRKKRIELENKEERNDISNIENFCNKTDININNNIKDDKAKLDKIIRNKKRSINKVKDDKKNN
jgi:hypothetical protein